MESALIEICVLCGFAHRDDRTTTRQRKPHFHWTPEDGEQILCGYTIHATVCVSCLKFPIDWAAYANAREHTSDIFYIATSFNASLPFNPPALLIKQYQQLCAALRKEEHRW